MNRRKRDTAPLVRVVYMIHQTGCGCAVRGAEHVQAIYDQLRPVAARYGWNTEALTTEQAAVLVDGYFAGVSQ